MAKRIAGRAVGMSAAIVLVLAGCVTVLFSMRITAHMDFGLVGIAVWLGIAALGLVMGTLGVFGVMSWAKTSKARH